jgi:hypothetical protein
MAKPRERWYAAHYDLHGELILSAPVRTCDEVGRILDGDPARYRERLAVIERGKVRTLTRGGRALNGRYQFKRGPRLR